MAETSGTADTVTGEGRADMQHETQHEMQHEGRGRRGPDPVALLVGLLTLGMATAAFIGEVPDLSGFDPRWLLAGGATVLGVLLLVGSLRDRRER